LLYIIGGGTVLGQFTASSNGVLKFSNGAGTDLSRLQLGGTTSSFPAIKRNGAAIDFRLADDSGYCDTYQKSGYIGNITIAGGATDFSNFAAILYGSGNSLFHIQAGIGNVHLNFSGASVANASIIVSSGMVQQTSYNSAIFDIRSTTKGFLPPRLTTTEVNAIATPAEGLVVFNTTISHLCVYQAAAWVKLSHSPM
jgi:hypothetical protein